MEPLHLMVMPLSLLEIMISKILAVCIIVLIEFGFSIFFIVEMLCKFQLVGQLFYIYFFTFWFYLLQLQWVFL